MSSPRTPRSPHRKTHRSTKSRDRLVKYYRQYTNVSEDADTIGETTESATMEESGLYKWSTRPHDFSNMEMRRSERQQGDSFFAKKVQGIVARYRRSFSFGCDPYVQVSGIAQVDETSENVEKSFCTEAIYSGNANVIFGETDFNEFTFEVVEHDLWHSGFIFVEVWDANMIRDRNLGVGAILIDIPHQNTGQWVHAKVPVFEGKFFTGRVYVAAQRVDEKTLKFRIDGITDLKTTREGQDNSVLSFLKMTAASLLYMGAYAAIMSYVEGWSYDSSWWFVFVTLTTVGYGDYYPETVAGKLINSFFILFNVLVMANFFMLAASFLVERSEEIFDKHVQASANLLRHQFVHEDDDEEIEIMEDLDDVPSAGDPASLMPSTATKEDADAPLLENVDLGEGDGKKTKAQSFLKKRLAEKETQIETRHRRREGGVPSRPGVRNVREFHADRFDVIRSQKWLEFRRMMAVNFCCWFFLFLICVVIFGFLHMLEQDAVVQHDRIIDSYHFIIVTLSSVGYGDMYPVKQKGGHWVASFVILFGTVVLSQFMSLISDYIIFKRRSRKQAEMLRSSLADASQIVEFDADNSGTITKDEWLSAMLVRFDEVDKSTINTILEYFDKVDEDNSGYITREELTDMIRSDKMKLASDAFES